MYTNNANVRKRGTEREIQMQFIQNAKLLQYKWMGGRFTFAQTSCTIYWFLTTMEFHVCHCAICIPTYPCIWWNLYSVSGFRKTLLTNRFISIRIRRVLEFYRNKRDHLSPFIWYDLDLDSNNAMLTQEIQENCVICSKWTNKFKSKL